MSISPHKTLAISLLALAAGVLSLPAEDVSPDWFYRAWQTEHGLPDNSISGIAQAPDGYLWFGTNGGAIRFNGKQFSPLPLRDIPGLPSRQVRAMLMDRSGRLWLALERGPVVRIGEDSFRVFGEVDGLPNKRAMSMADDAEGRVWVAYFGGVYQIDGNAVTKFGARHGVPNGGEATLACDSDGQLWLANNGKVGRLDDSGCELVRDFGDAPIRITASPRSGLLVAVGPDLLQLDPEGDQFSTIAKLPEGLGVNAIFEDRAGAVWIGTQDSGLLRIEDGGYERIRTSRPSIACIGGDREGNIWVGTRGGGLNLIRPRAIRFISESDGLPFSAIRSIACDASGRIWAVGEDGRLATQQETGWDLFAPLGGGEVMNCVAADSRGSVWVGTRNRGLLRIEGDEIKRFRVRDGLASAFVRSLLVARNGDVWVAGDQPDRLLRLRDGKISPVAHTGEFTAIRAMAETADGTVWVGSSDGRLFRVDGDRLVDESAIDGPLSLSVRTLHATPDGSLWIGYAGDGLGHLRGGQYKRITMAAGLHDDYISQIQDDGEGTLWIAANRGMFQVGLDELLNVSENPGPSERLRCRVFGSNDGIPSIQPSRDYAPTASRSPDNRLYFSTESGIVDVDPGRIRIDPLPPPVVLEKVTLDSQTVAIYRARSMLPPGLGELADLSQANPHLGLAPDHDKLVIDFAALSLTSPENVRFRYRLRPFDKDWQEVEGQPSVTFPRLPAGKYQFEVIACNHAGVWNNEGAVLGIVVDPFFWDTWWFRAGAGLLTAAIAGGLVFLGLRRRHRLQLQAIASKRALEEERSRIARDIHDDLGASLTRITLLSQSSLPAEDEAGETILDQIHSTSRHLMRSMEEVVWAVNPEHDSFDALANYLSNYAQGFLGIAEVRCRLEMPMTLPERPLSAQIRHNLFLAFKEALNNAVKHAEATEVRISLELGEEAFVLKVEDNGAGIDPNATAAPMRPTSGSGLANMKSRMDEIGGTCILHSTLGQGTTVEFKVPFRTKP